MENVARGKKKNKPTALDPELTDHPSYITSKILHRPILNDFYYYYLYNVQNYKLIKYIACTLWLAQIRRGNDHN